MRESSSSSWRRMPWFMRDKLSRRAKGMRRLLRVLEEHGPWSLWVMQSFNDTLVAHTPGVEPFCRTDLDLFYRLVLSTVGPEWGLEEAWMFWEAHRTPRPGGKPRWHLHGFWRCRPCDWQRAWRLLKESLWGCCGKAYVEPWHSAEPGYAKALAYCCSYVTKQRVGRNPWFVYTR